MVVVATPQIEMRPVAALKPCPGNARQHSKRQVRQIADSITRFGFTNPVLISDDGEIVAGHGRVMAAKELGLDAVPTLRLSHLSAEERRAYVLADNKLAPNIRRHLRQICSLGNSESTRSNGCNDIVECSTRPFPNLSRNSRGPVAACPKDRR